MVAAAGIVDTDKCYFLFHIVSVFQFHGFADGFFPGGINCPDDLGAYLGKEHQLGQLPFRARLQVDQLLHHIHLMPALVQKEEALDPEAFRQDRLQKGR